MVNSREKDFRDFTSRFDNLEVDAKIQTKKKFVKIEKNSKGTKIEVLKK